MDVPNAADWIAAARDELLAAANPDGGWSYRPGIASSTEPTALAVLALSGAGIAADVLSSAVTWLRARQRGDGFFTASPTHNEPSWTTPLAALALQRLGDGAAVDAAVNALLGESVYTFSAAASGGQYGYDTGIPGWPWTFGDFSFLEPTALAMIALKKAGHAGHRRVRDGTAMLRARVIPGSGWNYGEPQVLGGDLFPTVAPTGLALLALADEQDGITASAVDWLRVQQEQISTLFSLGWAATALNVLGASDGAWRAGVMSAWTDQAGRRTAMDTALCLLALVDAGSHPLRVG